MSNPESSDKIPARIFLIRHARPIVSKHGYFDAAAARQFITDYDAAQVEKFVLSHESIPYKEIKKVFCSTLVRSQLTAKAIFGNDIELIIDHDFREFERKIFSLPLVRLPIRFWLLSSRALWLMGLNSKGIESFKEAKKRVRRCAERLSKEAEQDKTVVLVAHGFLNNFIRRELRKKKWRLVHNGGSGFVSISMLEK
ncbi:histidine phosphatase family protein [Pontibacter ruber]|uniref:Histidine phosphatase family protein n=1 Tax=Pontibacter ruber TaxID=1343895 RepID=A0ABW5D186_9BACT|nr:histidine phosphatase family protein [Pontibacter ruber]